MKIYGWNDECREIINQAEKTSSFEKNRSLEGLPEKSRVDYRVNFSDRAQEMKKIHAVLATVSDVRIDKVVALRQEIRSGQYKVPTDLLAEKMLRHCLKSC